jgi:CHAT domain-containing protein
LGALSGCRQASPRQTFDHAYQDFVRGNLNLAQDEASRGLRQFHALPGWAWKFRILEAKAALARGLFEEVLILIKAAPLPANNSDLAISVRALAAEANIHLHRFAEAESLLADTLTTCSPTSAISSCGDLLQARGLLASEQGQSALAEQMHQLSLSFARSHGNSYLETTALLDLGNEALVEGHFDEAIDRSEAAYRVAERIDARILKLVIQGNIGWAYYRLGDLEKALELATESEKAAADLGDVFDQENELTNAGYVYFDQRKFDLAEQSFERALRLANQIKAKEDIYNAERVLARLALQTNELDKSSAHAQNALTIARESGRHADELYPMMVLGQVSARRGQDAAAQTTLSAVDNDLLCPTFLRWETQHALAGLFEKQKHLDDADHEYRQALSTFESARGEIQHQDAQISFLTNAASLYDDYVQFLVARGKPNEALRWADYSRARNLAEGLGLAKKTAADAPPLDAQQVARLAKGTLLFYWLSEKQSYMWAVTPHESRVFLLPQDHEIDATVQRYRRDLVGPQDLTAAKNQDGLALYQTLVAPAKSMLPDGSKVFIIPDESLNNLNFETLVASDPAPHYWIEDATIATVSSLRVLAASTATTQGRTRSLLLIGNTIAANDKYPELPKAAEQVNSVAGHFPADSRKVLTREQATPSGYLDGNPERFSFIHFVAHGTASRVDPLDSAIVLSKSRANDASFKLYARDIIRHPLHADLVTISACYGAGERAYSGEGLVGLSWAFLRAGSHNVIAALWEATDVSTEELMKRFYDELDRGTTPDVALRTAKLSLLRETAFHNPFYWAPFQLYTGS